MDRLKRPGEGFTILELIIAIAIAGVVFLAAANLLINFGNFTGHVVKTEAALMGASLGAFEEIAGRIRDANLVSGVPATPATSSTITLRLDTKVPAGCVAAACSFTPSVFTDDTTYTYWLSGTDLMRTGVTGDGEGKIIATGITTLSFALDATYLNQIKVILEVQATGGLIATGVTREHLETTVTLRARSAN